MEHEHLPALTCQDLGCRRLFLRGWKPAASAGDLRTPSVNVEIWVRYEHSTARSDELVDVLDYNVMRDALLRAGYPDSGSFIDRALDELMSFPIEAAYVEVVLCRPSEQWCGSRRACFARN